MRILHDASLGSSFQLSPLEGGWWAFKENPYNAQTMPRQTDWTATDRGLTGLLIEVADSYKPLTLCSYDNIQVSLRSCWFKASITLRIDRGNTFIMIYVYFMIFIQDICTYIYIYL